MACLFALRTLKDTCLTGSLTISQSVVCIRISMTKTCPQVCVCGGGGGSCPSNRGDFPKLFWWVVIGGIVSWWVGIRRVISQGQLSLG